MHIRENNDNKNVAPNNNGWDFLPQETLTQNKSIYGAYFEMAFHNFFITLSHIYSIIFNDDIMRLARRDVENRGKKFDEDFGNYKLVWEPMFTDFENALPEQKEQLEYLLSKHFPFLSAIDALPENKRHPKLAVIKNFSNVLRELRNFYSHYRAKLDYMQVDRYKTNISAIFDLMTKVYDGAKRQVKSRFGFDDRKMECANMFMRNTDKSITDRNGNMKKIVPKPNFRYALYTQDGRDKLITKFGLVFLSSLCLEKKYAKILADKTHVISGDDADVMNELISVYRIRLHIQRLTVTKSTDAMALDIINELRKCPKPLFDMLQPEDQAKFRIKPETQQDPEVLMVRHHDRFTYFLLKYIDDAKLFDKARFQVSLGRYFFKFYDKKCIDHSSETRVRALCKDVNGFGRISEIEELRKSEWKDLIRNFDEMHPNTADEKAYITDHHAQYMITNNRIGIYLRNEEDDQNILPTISPDGARNMSPTCWLSVYELPALAFLLHLYNGDGTRIEDIIQDVVECYHRLFADVRDGVVTPVSSEDQLTELLSGYGNIQVQALPQKLVDYLLMKEVDANEIFKQRAKAYLQELIDKTKYRLDRFEDDCKASSNVKENKFGKKSFVTIKPGKIADFLAHDMMFFQPYTAEKNYKLTGLNFRVLQACLATYSGDTKGLKRVLTSARIIGNANDDFCNPVVMALFRKFDKFSDIKQFYKEYLTERQAYLEKCLNRGDYERLSFLHASRTKWKVHDQEYYRQLAARYLENEYDGVSFAKGIELPRGLFEPYIRKELAEMMAMKDMAMDYSKNVSYLIYGYFRRVINDDSQSFYDLKRCYRLFNILYRRRPTDPAIYYDTAEIREMLKRSGSKSIRRKIEEYIQELSRKLTRKPGSKEELQKEQLRCNAMLTDLKKTETELKRYKVQDMLLLLIAKRILLNRQATIESDVSFKAITKLLLKDITKDDILSQKISLRVKVYSKNDHEKYIKQEDLKLKNYSQFYALLSDRRLPTLLDLIYDSVIERSLIEQELDNYDAVHPKVIKDIFQFEKRFFETHPIEDCMEDGDIPQLWYMLKETDMPSNIQNEVCNIRNSFAHLSYPKRYVANAQDIVLPEKAKTLSWKLKKHLKDEENQQH